MHIHHENVSSISTADGEASSEDGVFDVPAKLAAWLTRVHGFTPHTAPAQSAEHSGVEEPKREPRTRRPRKKTETTDDDPSNESSADESKAEEDGEKES